MNQSVIVVAVAVVANVFSLSGSAEVRHVPRDHQSIQAALDAAQPGDTVLVAAGTYREQIRLTPGVTLRSAGDDTKGELGLRRAETTILDGGSKKTDTPGVVMAESATLDGFTITGMGRYDDDLWRKHHATQGDEQSHDHIGHFGAPAIGVVGVTCVITNNMVHHNGDTGIGIRGEQQSRCMPQVTANICYRNMGGGIGSMAQSTAIIEGNTCFQNFYAGIGHDDASPFVIGNVCYENIRAGIGISEGACPVVRGNKCYRNRRAGIGVRTGEDTRPVIEDNECFENDMAGIGCEEHAAPIIRHNRCYLNVMAGIGSRSGAQPVVVSNECYENKMAGIGVSDAAVAVVVRNQSRQNETAGIGVRSGAQAVVCYNSCIQNTLVAIGLPDGATAVLHGNDLQRTGGMPPLVAVKGGASAVLSENQIRGGGVAGVLVEGRALLTGNRFRGNPNQGTAVWVWGGSQALIQGNVFDGYRQAVNASGAKVSISENEVRGFKSIAINVKQSTHPAHVFGNTAVSDHPDDKPVMVDGPTGIVADNVRVASDSEP